MLTFISIYYVPLGSFYIYQESWKTSQIIFLQTNIGHCTNRIAVHGNDVLSGMHYIYGRPVFVHVYNIGKTVKHMIF